MKNVHILFLHPIMLVRDRFKTSFKQRLSESQSTNAASAPAPAPAPIPSFSSLSLLHKCMPTFRKHCWPAQFLQSNVLLSEVRKGKAGKDYPKASARYRQDPRVGPRDITPLERGKGGGGGVSRGPRRHTAQLGTFANVNQVADRGWEGMCIPFCLSERSAFRVFGRVHPSGKPVSRSI